jgi:hypothetical protein
MRMMEDRKDGKDGVEDWGEKKQ